jgi:hypothetical protein
MRVNFHVIVVYRLLGYRAYDRVDAGAVASAGQYAYPFFPSIFSHKFLSLDFCLSF